jgi:EAL domain-containing protein (putative c-di-GMP-specific phosphodiesterase class I)
VESALKTLERSRTLVAGLRRAGIGLHIDEFGVGCSSLTTLHQLPIRVLKIAPGVIAEIDAELSRAIAGSVIALARSLDVLAIGAGIETADQREALVALGCDGGQGRLVAAEMDAGAVGELLARAR